MNLKEAKQKFDRAIKLYENHKFDQAREIFKQLSSDVDPNIDTANTKIISNNTEAISRGTTRYSAIHRADREQSAENGADHDLQRASIATSLTNAKRNLSNSARVTAELAQNFRDIETNIVKMMERKKEMEKPQPKQSRGMDFGR